MPTAGQPSARYTVFASSPPGKAAFQLQKHGYLRLSIPSSSPGREVRVRASLFRIVLALLYLAAFTVVAWTLDEGGSFYLTPLAERAHHEGYWRFKPGGTVGRELGGVGSAMMLVLLLYSVRKRVTGLRNWGPVSRWLDIHIFLGVMGPVFVVLHSSFKVQGLVALSFWSMVAVALSGVLGRYLYLQIPRTRAGDELSLAELQQQDAALSARLGGALAPDLRARLDHLTAASPRRGLLRSLGALLVADLSLRHRLRQFRVECRTLSPAQLREMLSLARQQAVVRRRIVFWDALHRLFHHWHVVHKPFAIVMYVFMAVHVVVASMTGYGWGP